MKPLTKTKIDFLFKAFNSRIHKLGYNKLKKPEFNALIKLIKVETAISDTLENAVNKYIQLVNTK